MLVSRSESVCFCFLGSSFSNLLNVAIGNPRCGSTKSSNYLTFVKPTSKMHENFPVLNWVEVDDISLLSRVVNLH